MAKKKAKKKVAKKAPARKTAAKKKSRPTRTKPAKKTARAKKKAAPKKKATPKKKAASKKSAAKKTARKKKAPARASRTVKKKKTAAKKKTGKRSSSKLGRPRVPADAQLDLVFRNDYKAREVFDFLGVATIRELEKLGPDQIIRMLTGPMVQTVGRIRKSMAIFNRSLAGDLEFAIEFKEAMAKSANSE